jgi:hypothetical protein
MNENQLKEWFWDKFNSCYYININKYPNHIYMIYDINFIRSKKLAIILDKEVKYPTELNGKCLFEITNGILWYDYTNIKKYIEKFSTEDISLLISKWLKEKYKENNYLVLCIRRMDVRRFKLQYKILTEKELFKTL